MKIHILYNFQKGPWGGGNQFLKALKKEFKNQKIYEENIKKANAILFNNYPFGSEFYFNQILYLKQKYPNKIIIFRLDGPVSLVRDRDKEIDEIINLFNNFFIDGIIFQSNWCKKNNKKYFDSFSTYETIINNAPDDKIFNKIGKKNFNPKDKVKLIAASWSSNWRKGFDIYKFLDENLDYTKYEMTFVGNLPIEFKNIKWIKPVSSNKLAKILKQNDIYITASQNDPCSNSLIEALSCGLPAVALNDGGHPELIRNGGELFRGKEDIIEKIDKVTEKISYYQLKIPKYSIGKVAREYYEFAQKIYNDMQKEKYTPKQVNFLTKISFCKMKLMILKWKVKNKLRFVTGRIWRT